VAISESASTKTLFPALAMWKPPLSFEQGQRLLESCVSSVRGLLYEQWSVFANQEAFKASIDEPLTSELKTLRNSVVRLLDSPYPLSKSEIPQGENLDQQHALFHYFRVQTALKMIFEHLRCTQHKSAMLEILKKNSNSYESLKNATDVSSASADMHIVLANGCLEDARQLLE